MATDPSPILRRRQAGARLRQLREAAGKSLADVAAYLECSAAKVSRIENGRLLARIPDVRNMLDLFEADPSVRDELLALVRESRERGWWQNYPDVVNDVYGQFLGTEASAAQIWQYEEYLVPGLLQTRDYAYNVASHRLDVSDEYADRNVEVRMLRQEILAREVPPQLHFVLDESVLHRIAAFGGTVARQQLDRLIEVGRQSNVILQVQPYSVGITSHIAFTLFGFPDPADPKIVYLDGLYDATLESRASSVGHYVVAFDTVRSLALDPAQSSTFIAELAASTR